MVNLRKHLDEKDKAILSILSENARATYSDIAKKIGLSDVAVIKRIKRLERDGVIRRYTIIVDPEKLGYSIVSITGIDVEPEYLFKVISLLKEKEYVKYLALTSGDHNIMIIIWARGSNEANKIHNELESLPGVKRVCPAIILDVFKEEYV